MTNGTNPIIPVELPLTTWRFIREILSSLKRSAEQPPRKGEHRSHTLRLIDKTPYSYEMLQDAFFTIKETLAAELATSYGVEGGSLDSPLETTFPEVKNEP